MTLAALIPQLERAVALAHSTLQAYNTALAAIDSLSQDDAALPQIGLQLLFPDGLVAPVPADRELLLHGVTSAATVLSHQILKIWDDIHRLGEQGKSYCDKAAAAAAATMTDPAPEAGVVVPTVST